ncbi:MAG: hypothetical protein ACYC08_08950, partial [Armatimonadota bacterium]
MPILAVMVVILMAASSIGAYAAVVKLSGVPSYDWSYGCAPTSGAMMMGYYDRHGYSKMYTGTANGGVAPLDNSVWGSGNCPISATKNGVDGRTTRGHVDDYWVAYNNNGNDPYQTGGWTPHADDSIADFMGTSKHALNSADGSTTYWYSPNGSPLSNYGSYGCSYGLQAYAEYCGYSVVQNYIQLIYGYNGNSNGFTFANYKSEIDAGRPVMIQMEGHSMVGYGYDSI